MTQILKTLPLYVSTYGLEDCASVSEHPRWSGASTPPAIGDRVKVTMNGLGYATVTGYIICEGWLGLAVDLEAAPAWHKRQNNGDPSGIVFGAEIEVCRSYKPEVLTPGSDWAGNALRFANEIEADAYALDLAFRWTAVQATRVVPSTDPVNARFDEGRTIHLSDKGGVHV